MQHQKQLTWPTRTPKERFEEKWTPEPFSGCWLWTAQVSGSKYGKSRINNKDYESAHRSSWILHRGAIPEGMFVLHKCDTPQCVNPDHLYLGTAADNARDREIRNRSSFPRLTVSEIVAIRQAKGTTREIALRFGIAHSAVWKIQNRETYSWVFPKVEEQRAYWETKDHGGNILPDRVAANESQYGEQCVYCGKNSWECEHYEEANQ